MKAAIKQVVVTAILISVIIARPAIAAAAITIDGVVYDKANKPVAGVTVVAWCGGVNFFGGSGKTDTNGHYIIHTNSDDCPLGTELTVTTDINGDGLSDGASHTQTHTSSTISIHLGKYISVPIPEYTWVSASIAAVAGAGIVGFVRRSSLRRIVRR